VLGVELAAPRALIDFGSRFQQRFAYLRRPASRLLITLLGEAVEPDSPLAGFYGELQLTMRKWLADCMSDVTLPPGVDQNTLITVVYGCVIGAHQQWRVTPEDIDLDAAKAAIKRLFVPQAKRRRRSRG
jgi:TetR/AcrR family transcriptional regulator, acrAB operon repressor